MRSASNEVLAPSGSSFSPMMQQYQEAKSACGDALLLFRMGDFYELFFEDAKTAARAVGLTLTARDKGENAVPMAGFPHHQLEGYLGKLIKQGFRVAICEQVEDPRKAKGLVRREVTRVVTPGTLTDDGLLDPRQCNYLAAVVGQGKPAENDAGAQRVGIAWVELSTGRFHAATTSGARLGDELARIDPSECLLEESTQPLLASRGASLAVTMRPAWAFSRQSAIKALTDQFGTASLEGFGFDETEGLALRAAGAIIDYLQETQKSSLEHIDRLIPYRRGDRMEIDEPARRSLELTRTLRDGSRDGSLLAFLDETVTAMGSRLLADRLANPLVDSRQINVRLDAVEELLADAALTGGLQSELRSVYDMQRLLARVTTGRASPRDLRFIGQTLRSLPRIKARLAARKSQLLAQMELDLDLCPEVRSKLEAALVDHCPLSAREGGFIRDGFDAELDRLRQLATGGKEWIANYQAEERQRSAIPSLRVGYNKVFGYFLEVTNAHQEKVPPHYIRKQTLKNAERYITPELKEYEQQVLTADDKAKELEYDLFLQLRAVVQDSARRLQTTASVLAELDVLASLAELARKRDYCRPELVDEAELNIVDGRHPVLDIVEPEGTFVPNDTRLDGESGMILLITGPNMAGKSTYIRQVALITIMAQMGSFVPARQARIGLVDQVFARVGASDQLARGQSTFMVEMTETARILHNATPRSLVILDEIGRGTSTYDGISLAWSIVEYLHDRMGCRTLFATHYHELTELANSLSGVANLNVAVKEWEDKVVFLHKIVPGAADKSYGIHVARLAGVPREVNERAKQILAQLEDERVDQDGRPKVKRTRQSRRSGDLQLTLFGFADHPLLDEIRQVDLDQMTPLDALGRIKKWQIDLGGVSPEKRGD
jgi:DNA mismatch repair protein MutS